MSSEMTDNGPNCCVRGYPVYEHCTLKPPFLHEATFCPQSDHKSASPGAIVGVRMLHSGFREQRGILRSFVGVCPITRMTTIAAPRGHAIGWDRCREVS